MRIGNRFVGLMAGSLALVGCTKPAPQTNPPAVDTAAAGKPARGNPTDRCGTFSPTDPFEMKVNSAFHVIRTGPNVTPHHPHSNPGQLDTYTAIMDGQSAQITIELTGKETFDGGSSAFQLKPQAAEIFCGVTVSTDGKTLNFYTFRQAGGPTSSSYSLAVRVPDDENPQAGAPALKVIIDPVVDNDGFVKVAPPPPPPPRP